MVPAAVARFIAAQGWGAAAAEPVGGGCINAGHVVSTTRGPTLFLKLNASAPPDMFVREAEGLAALGAAKDGPRVPAPLLTGADFLLLEYLPAARPAPRWSAALGERLAALHAVTGRAFGFDHDNYIGSTPQSNRWTPDGWEFFAEQRLRFQARLAVDRGLLTNPALRRIERLAQRLRELVPEQPASLIHGDLWGGNIVSGPDGLGCLIDPAAHFGWAEADLAMTTLFGRLPEAFYSAYAAARPLAPGWEERFDLYNLYHLLNHLNLFGRGYAGAVEEAARRFG
ncbi:MAG: fructosamine kinase family protein [Anaerolineales bacterium]|nr:fructosamine kinase family protein [Anaerolineales bacterium]